MKLVTSLLEKKKSNPNFLIFALFLAAIATYIPPGASDVALPILLKQKNYSETLVGIAIGFNLVFYASACLLLPYFLKRFSCSSILYSSSACMLLTLLSFVFRDHPILFISCYVIQGAFFAITVIILTNSLATLSRQFANKNILIGFFTTMTSAGYFLGIVLASRPPLVAVSHFFEISAIFVICFLPLCCSRSFDDLIELEVQKDLESPINFYNSIISLQAIPVGLIAILVFGINHNVIDGVAPLWGISHGMNFEEAAFLGLPILLGEILLTPFLSSFFKSVGYIKIALLYLSFLITLVTIIHILNLYHPNLALPFPGASLLIKMFDHPLMMIIGGLTNTFEALYLCKIADEFKGARLIGALAAASFIAYVTGAISCAITGYIITKNGYHQIGTFLITINGILMIALLILFFPKKTKMLSREPLEK